MLEFERTSSKHLERKYCSHQNPNPKCTWKSAFLTAFVQKCTSNFDGAALPQRLWTLKGFPFETFVLQCFSHFWMVGGPANITLSTAYPRQNGHDALSWDSIYIDYSYEIINLYNPSNHVEKTCLKKNMPQNDDISICFWRHFSAIKPGVLKQNDDICIFFGGLLCGLHKVHKPRVYRVFSKYGVQIFDMLRAACFGRRHFMCGTKSHITL